MAKKLDKLNQRYNADPLVPATLEKIFAWGFFTFAAACIISGFLLFDTVGYAVYAALFSAASGITARFPRFSWYFVRRKIERVSSVSDPEPSHFWLFGHKVGYWLLFVFAVAAFLIGLYETFPQTNDNARIVFPRPRTEFLTPKPDNDYPAPSPEPFFE
ncbi:MAG: hypothetical protein LBR76_05255 [Oscillospiraceae bacterium]|nr:hypothetical protein [Oscillospiraceae bacterium]